MSFTWATIGQNVDKIKTWNPLKSEQLTTFKYIDLGSLDKDKKEICLDLVQEISSSEAPSRARQLVKTGDVLISTVRPNLNGIAVVPKELDGATASTGFCVLRANEEKLDSTYLRYWVESTTFVSDMVNKSTGASYPAVSDKIINDSELPLPPLETQKQIAAVLEKADQLRKDCKLLEQELNSLAQSVFIEMFGDPVTNPKGWKTQMLGSISKVQLGKMLSSASKIGINSKKYLRNANVKWRNIEIHDLLEMDFTDKEIEKFQLITGDLLVCEGGEIGRCAIWIGQVEDCYYQKALHRVRLNPDLATAEYIQEYFFWMAKLGGLISSTNEVTFKHLTAEKMNKLVVPLPPIETQRKFKTIYSSIQSELEHNAKQMAQTEMVFQSLMQKAFNDELNLENANTQ
ncbi:restriction modification system DNA specificity domain protein [Shewanella baltica OS223]|uniref:restriction endonuclease subunit S n=1 Tax=Shewanella baltica TaxID=62322 RepID=UPI0001531247|nr:restriction endonuclease subunit S [Shewanella baltica]ACK48656.1 restriction modification system DNA specificity domain protein [Shewanella baltica OS223]